MKLLYFDVETTGLDSKRHGIIQLSGLIEVDGIEKERFNYNIAPFESDAYSDKALLVHKVTRNEMRAFPKPQEIYSKFVKMLSQYVERYDTTDKFTPIGYNVRFDLDFLNQFFLKNNDTYFGSYVSWYAVDPLALLYFLKFQNKIKLENYKLETVCNHFGIELQAHDAFSDILATKRLLEILQNKFKYEI